MSVIPSLCQWTSFFNISTSLSTIHMLKSTPWSIGCATFACWMQPLGSPLSRQTTMHFSFHFYQSLFLAREQHSTKHLEIKSLFLLILENWGKWTEWNVSNPQCGSLSTFSAQKSTIKGVNQWRSLEERLESFAAVAACPSHRLLDRRSWPASLLETETSVVLE